MEILKQFLEKENLPSDEETMAKFEKYYQLLIEWNNKFNLTAIIEREEVFVKHFIDSLHGARFIQKGAKGIDIGSGAGFPAIPLLIVRDDIYITMVDSLNKRVGFLVEVIAQLGITNGCAIHSRAEDFAKNNRDKGDFVVARAVAPLSTLAEYSLPLIKMGGKLLAYKGNNFAEEIAGASVALRILGGEIEQAAQFDLEKTGLLRSIIVIKKHKRTRDIYPRDGNKPKSNPL